MAEGDSPTVARRRVRLAVREAREAAGLTQLQVAEEMEWSLSKVIRIENGEVSITPNDLRPLLAFLGIKDRAQVGALLADAKIARTRQRQAWYQAPEYREHLTEPLRRLIEYEAEATEFRYYQAYFMPGPFQTPSYAAALTGKLDDELPAEKIRARIEARRIRRETLLRRLGSVRVFMLLDESVLLRPIGGAEVFVEQLAELNRLASEQLVKIRIVPFELEGVLTNNATFDLLTLGSEEERGEILYRENGLTDELVEDRTSTSRHHDRFTRLWAVATVEADTISYIRERIERLQSTIDKRAGTSR
jgi:transcriptional regulator with XRE-family HTH domain